MDWNKFIFPQPKPTYTRTSHYGHLIAVPRVSHYTSRQIAEYKEKMKNKSLMQNNESRSFVNTLSHCKLASQEPSPHQRASTKSPLFFMKPNHSPHKHRGRPPTLLISPERKETGSYVRNEFVTQKTLGQKPHMAISNSPRVFVSQTLQSKTPKAKATFRFDFDEQEESEVRHYGVRNKSPMLRKRDSSMVLDDEAQQSSKIDREQVPINDSKLMRASSRILEKKPIPSLTLIGSRKSIEPSAKTERCSPTRIGDLGVKAIAFKRKVMQRMQETTHHSFTAAKQCFSDKLGQKKLRLGGLRSEERSRDKRAKQLQIQISDPSRCKKSFPSQTPIAHQEKPETIPCLYLKNRKSHRLLIYFHGNAEDIGSTKDLLQILKLFLDTSVVAVEYPGYGIYQQNAEGQQLKPTEQRILYDASCVFSFFTQLLGWKAKDVIIMGRSIGTGPAIWLSAQKNPGALALISPHTSIRGVVRDLFGLGVVAQFLVNERFRNLEIIKEVKCPTFILHGEKDKLIPPQHSRELCKNCAGPTCLLMPKKMDHNSFNIRDDLCKPLKQFLGAVFFEQKKAKAKESRHKSTFALTSPKQEGYPRRKLQSTRLEPKVCSPMGCQLQEIKVQCELKGDCFSFPRVPSSFYIRLV